VERSFVSLFCLRNSADDEETLDTLDTEWHRTRRILPRWNFRDPERPVRPVVSMSEFCAGSNQEFRRINVASLLEQGRRVIPPSRSNGRYRSQWNCHFSLMIPRVNSSGKFQLAWHRPVDRFPFGLWPLTGRSAGELPEISFTRSRRVSCRG